MRLLFLALLGCVVLASGETVQAAPAIVLLPTRVFDGNTLHEGWGVVVQGDRIEASGPIGSLVRPEGAQLIELPGQTLLPGLIDAHSHVLLHPYTETPWNIQVANESETVRVVRATNHLRATLLAGFTTIRDLGTEGAGWADIGLKQAVDQGIIPGPHMIVVTKALVATGSYGPKGYAAEWTVPQGAAEADGTDALVREVRNQIGHGADWVKVYADYRWGPQGQAAPTFSIDELRLIVETARSSGRPTAAHAVTPEGMRRAILAGVETIEHGTNGTADVFQLMKDHGTVLIPTLAATGDRPGAKESFQAALAAGVTIGSGSDVGVFAHGDNARELERMVEFGMSPTEALRAATSVDARVLHLHDKIGRISPGMQADIISVEGNPAADIHALRLVRLVMKGGLFQKKP